MYVATASPRPKRTAFDGSGGGGGGMCPVFPPLGSATALDGDMSTRTYQNTYRERVAALQAPSIQ